MDDQKQAAKTHILWATNMDDEGYADVLFLEKTPDTAYSVGINCGGHVIVKPLREWHRLGALPDDPSKRVMSSERRPLPSRRREKWSGGSSGLITISRSVAGTEDASGSRYRLGRTHKRQLRKPHERRIAETLTVPILRKFAVTAGTKSRWSRGFREVHRLLMRRRVCADGLGY